MPSGDWPLPYQRGRFLVWVWWRRSHRLIIKALWAAVSPLLSCLHCVSLYLVCPVIWPVRQCFCVEDGQREVEQSDQRDRSVHFPPRLAAELPASCGFIWVTPGKAREAWVERQESAPPPTPPPPPYPSIPPGCVDDLCSSVSSSAAASSTHILHEDVSTLEQGSGVIGGVRDRRVRSADWRLNFVHYYLSVFLISSLDVYLRSPGVQ